MRISDEEKCWLLLWDIADAPSITTCHFEADSKGIYPDRNTVWSFRRRKSVGNRCGLSLMFSLLWVVVIEHIIFMMRRVSFCYIWIEVKYWWFDMGYSPLDYLYMKTFIEFLVSFQSKTAFIVGYMCWTDTFHVAYRLVLDTTISIQRVVNTWLLQNT